MTFVAERPKRGSSRRLADVTDPLLSDGAASYTPSISERRGTSTTFLHSGIKNADAQSNASGSVSGTRVYDAFGAELSSTGSWQGAFGYAGGFGYQEDANGFKLLGHRYYDPSTGRFLTRDPAKDGRNWYAYCDNAPVRNGDASGLWHLGKQIYTGDAFAPDDEYEAALGGASFAVGAWWEAMKDENEKLGAVIGGVVTGTTALSVPIGKPEGYTRLEGSGERTSGARLISIKMYEGAKSAPGGRFGLIGKGLMAARGPFFALATGLKSKSLWSRAAAIGGFALATFLWIEVVLAWKAAVRAASAPMPAEE